jgi:hypothetical protein
MVGQPTVTQNIHHSCESRNPESAHKFLHSGLRRNDGRKKPLCDEGNLMASAAGAVGKQ